MASDEDWLYHLPAFLERVQEEGAQDVVGSVPADVEGVLYHHRGVRLPGHNATFVWQGDAVELAIDGVGERGAWITFEGNRSWDFFLSRTAGDAPCLAWMTDAEYEAEEAETFDTKAAAVGMGRFSFGIYLQSPAAWSDLEEEARSRDTPFFIYRPGGRTLVPEGPLEAYADVLPAEVLSGGDDPPDHLGLESVRLAGMT